MTTPIYEGEVRLGIPYDIVSGFLPPVLKAFTQAYPRIMISLDCRPSRLLLESLDAGEINLAVTTELGCQPHGESLVMDRLVWAGAKGGSALRQRPLPLFLGNESCAFRPPVLKALTGAGIDWRPVSEISNMDAMNATVQMDLAVGGMLASAVSANLDILGPASGLPPLPSFSINLYLPKTGATPVSQELARHIREGFRARPRQAA